MTEDNRDIFDKVLDDPVIVGGGGTILGAVAGGRIGKRIAKFANKETERKILLRLKKQGYVESGFDKYVNPRKYTTAGGAIGGTVGGAAGAGYSAGRNSKRKKR